jgi:RNA-directed DNA polymerase
LSPLLANIALSVLDEHLMGPWKPGGAMSTWSRRAWRRRKGLATWRLVRYADDFVVLVFGGEEHAQALRGEIAHVLEPLGLRLSPAKTQVVHMSDGFSFLGFRIRWKRKRGSDKWYVYTFIDDRPIRSLKAKIRALTHKTSQQDFAYVLTRLGQIMRGWAPAISSTPWLNGPSASWTPSPGGGWSACYGPGTAGTGASSVGTWSPRTGGGGSRRTGWSTSGLRA